MPCALQFAIITHFETLTDPRVKRTQVHKLLDILVIALSRRSAARTLGPTSNDLAWPNSVGLPNSWNCPAGSLRTIRLAGCSRCSIQPSSTAASAVGFVHFGRR